MANLRKRIAKDGKIVYLIDFYFQGKRIVRSTKTGDLKTAKLVLKEIEAKIAKSTFKIEDINPQKSIYLKQFMEEYLEYSGVHKAHKTYLADQLSLKTFIQHIGDKSLETIDQKQIDQYANFRSAQIKKSSVNVELRHLKAAFSKAKEWHYIPSNPFKEVKLFRIPQSHPLYLKREDLNVLLDSIEETWLKEIVIFAVNTGVRIGELVNIEWSDIDFKNRMIHIRNKEDFTTKSRQERSIPMNAQVYSLLANLVRNGTHVFPNSCGHKRDSVFVSRTFKEYIRKISLDERLTFHSLRHTFASHLVQKGVSLYIVSKLLGHADIKTTMIYSHLAPETYQQVVNLLSSGGSGQYAAVGTRRERGEPTE